MIRKSGNRFSERIMLKQKALSTCPRVSPCRQSPRHVADKVEHTVGLRRPVRRSAEPNDDQPLGGDDDDVLPDRALGEEGIARHAPRGAVVGPKTVAAIGPETRANADPAARRRRCRIVHPALGQDPLSPDHAVIEIEQPEPRPVARAGQHLARSLRRAGAVEFERHVGHAERIEQFAGARNAARRRGVRRSRCGSGARE